MIKAKTLDIGQVSKQCGLPASTLRYYDEIGLIQSVGRNGLRRVFDFIVLEQLEFIALSRRAGFSLEETKEMLCPNGTFKIDRAQLVKKADDLDKHIRQLCAIRDGLRHAANCQAPSHMECPTFQRILSLAGKTQAKYRS